MSERTKRKKKVYLSVSMLILCLSMLFTAFVFRTPFVRLIESCKDFGLSVAVFFVSVFENAFLRYRGSIPNVSTGAARMPDFSRYRDYIGFNSDSFSVGFSEVLKSVFNIFNFIEYNILFLNLFSKLLLFLTFLIPMAFIILSLIKACYFQKQEDFTELGKKSPLWRFIEKSALKLKPAILEIVEYIKHFYKKKYYLYSFAFIWALNFGLLAPIFDFLAWYLYFAGTFDVVSFLYWLLRVFLNLLIIFKSTPFIVWFTAVCVIYYRVQRSKALDLLRHNEAKNCGFIKGLELCTLVIGEMGKGKTTLVVDMVLSLVNIFKTDSLKILYRIEMLFPGFSFASFRADLVPVIASRDMTCKAHVVEFVDKLIEEGDLYGYVSELYGSSVGLGNRILVLRDALIIYGHAFLVYQNNNPTAANFPVRFDGKFDDSKFLQLWDGDFFVKRSESRYSHILNQDIMRFGNKVNAASEHIGSFGYGIYVNTELAKARGNQHTNAIYDPNDLEANPKNDLYEYSHMMSRHPDSTVDNIPFFKFIADEQRATSLEAKILQNMAVLEIGEKSDLKLAITGFDWLFKLRDRCDGFESFYLQYQNARTDMTLALMLPKLFVAGVRLVCERLENIYGYRELTLIKHKGNSFSGNNGNDDIKQSTYYLSNMKVYAERFTTDCYSQFFSEMQKKCKTNIEDYPTYEGLRMSWDEMKQQNDYFIMKLMNMTIGDPTTVESSSKGSNNLYEDLIFEE